MQVIHTAHQMWAETWYFSAAFAQLERVNLSHTSEFLLLLLSHPVDGEAGFSSESPPQDALVGLSLHVRD